MAVNVTLSIIGDEKEGDERLVNQIRQVVEIYGIISIENTKRVGVIDVFNVVVTPNERSPCQS